jgi:hypothetical protein
MSSIPGGKRFVASPFDQGTDRAVPSGFMVREQSEKEQEATHELARGARTFPPLSESSRYQPTGIPAFQSFCGSMLPMRVPSGRITLSLAG